MTTALLYGAAARPSIAPPNPWGPLVAGITIALLVALIVGVTTLIRASIPAPGSGKPSPSPSVAASPR